MIIGTSKPTSTASQIGFALVLVSATLLGIGAGSACHAWLTPQQAAMVAADLAIVTEAFLRLIKMIIAPLVFASLVAAIARMGSAKEIGRIGSKTLAWFVGASCVSLGIGLCMAHWLKPGLALHEMPGFLQTLPAEHVGNATDLSAAGFMRHLIPSSFIKALADNEILQVVVFSIFVGTAAAGLKERASRVVELAEQLATLMFRVTDYVMKCAPIAIFAALAASISLHGIGIIGIYARFVGGFYLSLGLLWGLLIAALALLAGARGLRLLIGLRQPLLLAFATSSSEVAYPRLLEALVAFGVPRRIASFVLPLGYSLNLDGAMMYCSFAILFIAQAYGVELTWLQQLALFGLLLVSTKGLAGVPRAAIAVLAVTLPYFNLPEGGVALVLAVDYILDMGRAATNIIGNAVAAAAVAAWEARIASKPSGDSV